MTLHRCTHVHNCHSFSSQQQQSSNVVVVSSQPQAVQAHVVQRRYGTGDHGLVLAISATFCVFFFGWWIGLACTIPAIFIALSVRTVLIIYIQDLGSANSPCYRGIHEPE